MAREETGKNNLKCIIHLREDAGEVKRFTETSWAKVCEAAQIVCDERLTADFSAVTWPEEGGFHRACVTPRSIAKQAHAKRQRQNLKEKLF